jgi:prephenate dehydratase
MLPECHAAALPSFEAVAAATSSNPGLLGVLPIRNNIAGDVHGVQALIQAHRLRTVRSFDLEVRMHLMGLPSRTANERIKTVVSHPVALVQCEKALSALDVTLVEAPSTAIAAQTLRDPETAVLASEEAARLYKLQIVQRDMQDRESVTTFLLLSRSPDYLA